MYTPKTGRGSASLSDLSTRRKQAMLLSQTFPPWCQPWTKVTTTAPLPAMAKSCRRLKTFSSCSKSETWPSSLSSITPRSNSFLPLPSTNRSMERPRSSTSGQSVSPATGLRFSSASRVMGFAGVSTPRSGGGVVWLQLQTNSAATARNRAFRVLMIFSLWPAILHCRATKLPQVAALQHALRRLPSRRADHGPPQLLGGDHRARRDRADQRQQRPEHGIARARPSRLGPLAVLRPEHG